MTLEDHVAVVTGSGQGIGKAIALRLAEVGADIAVLDMNGTKAESTARDIRDRGRRGVMETLDVSDPAAVRAAIGNVVAELGRIDILINNAGIETRSSTSDQRQSVGNLLLHSGSSERDGNAGIRPHRERLFGGRLDGTDRSGFVWSG